MCPPVSVIAVLSTVVFLGGAALGMLVLVIISIHRTSRAPLSEIHATRGGSVSRRVLTGGRVTRKEDGQ
jgi:hypothetical protein